MRLLTHTEGCTIVEALRMFQRARVSPQDVQEQILDPDAIDELVERINTEDVWVTGDAPEQEPGLPWEQYREQYIALDTLHTLSVKATKAVKSAWSKTHRPFQTKESRLVDIPAHRSYARKRAWVINVEPEQYHVHFKCWAWRITARPVKKESTVDNPVFIERADYVDWYIRMDTNEVITPDTKFDEPTPTDNSVPLHHSH